MKQFSNVVFAPDSNKKLSTWFYRPKPLICPWFRLFCFPYAGGSAYIYRDWPKRVPDGVEIWAIELPGHQRRFNEPLFQNMNLLINSLYNEIIQHTNIPYAFFGHSFGAHIAFELARRIRDSSSKEPKLLFLSGARPHKRNRNDAPLHTLSDKNFIDAISLLGGIPQKLLGQKDLLDLMLPVLRADVAMSEMWQSTHTDPLEVAITALGGMEDPEVNFDDLLAWREETRGDFQMHTFPGNHFFIHTHLNLVFKTINNQLSALTVVTEIQ